MLRACEDQDVVQTCVRVTEATCVDTWCPLVSGENASTAQDDGEIVLLVHCKI